MKNKSGLVLFIIASLVVSGCGSGEKKASNEEEAVEVAAKVDDWSLSRADLQTVIDGMPESQKSKYDTPGGRAELADLLIAEELYYREGLKMGLDNKENIQKQIERFARGLVVKEYYSNSIEPLAHPSEEEMRDYYEDNREKFSSQPIARAQHIFSTSKEKLVKLKKRIDAGEKFTTLAQKYSEDEHSKADGGDLGFFNPGGYIRGMAYSDEISDVCFSLPVG
ncbi:MAG: peptidylprolyl isomerase, partial [Candidatus Krumholzibacteria bacterium]|nr:peptidylprolyl isomerase [Candidatus Krumholzibacteria bacterium]